MPGLFCHHHSDLTPHSSSETGAKRENPPLRRRPVPLNGAPGQGHTAPCNACPHSCVRVRIRPEPPPTYPTGHANRCPAQRGHSDHNTHERTRNARKPFVSFAAFRGLRGPNPHPLAPPPIAAMHRGRPSHPRHAHHPPTAHLRFVPGHTTETRKRRELRSHRDHAIPPLVRCISTLPLSMTPLPVPRLRESPDVPRTERLPSLCSAASRCRLWGQVAA